jgi:polysaccharide biosynthesis/export protein
MRRITILALAMSICACGPRLPLQSTPELTVVQGDVLPAPDRQDLANFRSASYVGPFDQLNIVVFGVEDLTQEVQTDASNRFSLPLVGTIDATGRTAPELAEEIRVRLADRYIRDPKVAVNIKNERATSSAYVTVDGQVKEPGLYPVAGNMTLIRAIAAAKGASETAKLDDVVILRTSGGRRMAALYNLTAIRRGVYADPSVYPNDVIVVGDSPSRRLFQTLVAVSPVLAAPIIAILQR